jgi:hypothetical protein
MGLEKTITNNQGIDTSYWNIDQLLIKHKDKQVSIILAGYADKTKRDNGFRAISKLKYQINEDTYDTTLSPDILDASGNPLHVGYEWIKANTEFSDAIDA